MLVDDRESLKVLVTIASKFELALVLSQIIAPYCCLLLDDAFVDGSKESIVAHLEEGQLEWDYQMLKPFRSVNINTNLKLE